MAEAAHPQHDAGEPEVAADGSAPVIPEEQWDAARDDPKNPFPTTMTVPHIDGGFATVDLAVVDGIVYAPRLDEAPIDPGVRQYVVQYCAAWSSSVLAAGKLETAWPAPPRRAQILVTESQLHALLGLAADERLLRVAYDDVNGTVRFVVESPRLPMQPYWDGGPPVVALPIAASYEQQAR